MQSIVFAQTWFGDDLLSPRNVGILVWTGIAVLTVALVIVMRTNWGQAKPLSKCIALSIFAHVLFLAYAYGTRLIFDHPAPFDEQFIRLAMVSGSDDAAFNRDGEQEHPWDNFAVDSAIPPDVASLQRQSPEITVDMDVPDEAAPMLVSQLPMPAELVETTQPLPEATPMLSQPAIDAMPSAVPIEIPEQHPIESTDSPTPNEVVAAPPLLELPPVEPQEYAQPTNADSVSDANLQNISEASAVAVSRIGAEDVTMVVANSGPPSQDLSSLPTTAPLPMTEVDAVPLDGPTSAQPVVYPRQETLRLGDGAPLPPLYRMRAAEERLSWLEQRGGSQRTERAVRDALKWLAENQQQDGRWDPDRHGAGKETRVLGHDRGGAGADADSGITGLALLAFLGAGHTHFEGEYRRNVQHGLEYLVAKQARSGDLSGGARLFAKMYCHGIATLALSEAYAMTGDHRLREPVERAARYTVDAQDPTTGGWRYQPGDQGDMSQFGWQLMALKSAEAGGIPIPSQTRTRMLKFMASTSMGRHGGLASYRPGDGPSRTMTAEAMACRYFLGEHHDSAATDEAVAYILEQTPAAGKANLYYWYYGTLSMFQVNGNGWDRWNRAMQRQLLSRQESRGHDAGSWDANTVWGTYGGRVYSTAMSALCLEVYYRYLTVHDG